MILGFLSKKCTGLGRGCLPFACFLLCQVFFSSFAQAGTNPFIQTVLTLYTNPIKREDIPQLAKYDVLDLNRFNYDDVNQNTWGSIRQLNPDIEIYVYQLGSETNVVQDDFDTVYLNSIARFKKSRGSSAGALDTNLPKLFLLNDNGERIFNPNFPNTVLMDFGSVVYQKYWVEATLQDIVNKPWKADGVFIDNCTVEGGRDSSRNLNLTRPVAYKDAASWNNAMNAYVKFVTAALHGDGQKVFVNRGNSRTQEGYDAWIALDSDYPAPDIVMEEGAFAVAYGDSSDVQFYREDDWKRQVDVVGRLQRSRVALLSHTDLSPERSIGKDNFGRPASFWQILWYSMCSYHLARQDNPNNAYFMFGAKEGKVCWWFDEYDRINLGKAIGIYQVMNIEETNIYIREFEKGYIMVNPTLKSVLSLPLPVICAQLTHENLNTDFSTLPGIAIIELPSHHGVVLLKKEVTENSSPLLLPPPVIKNVPLTN